MTIGHAVVHQDAESALAPIAQNRMQSGGDACHTPGSAFAQSTSTRLYGDNGGASCLDMGEHFYTGDHSEQWEVTSKRRGQ